MSFVKRGQSESSKEHCTKSMGCGVSKGNVTALCLSELPKQSGLIDAVSEEHRRSADLYSGLERHCSEPLPQMQSVGGLNSLVRSNSLAASMAGVAALAGENHNSYWGDSATQIWQGYYLQRVQQRAAMLSSEKSTSRSRSVRVDTALGPEYHVVPQFVRARSGR